MAYDGTGNFTRLFSWQAEEAAGNGIVSDDHDTEDDNFARGFNDAFCRDGQAPATGPFNMAGQKIMNLGTATLDGDAVPLGQLTGSGAYPPIDFKKAINLTGADLNGRINFTSLTGVQGIGWNGADLSWLARLKETDKLTNRLVLNNKADGTGTDVVIADDYGNFGCTSFTYNLSQDPDGDFRAIHPGWIGRLYWTSSGGLNLQAIDAATVTDDYVSVMTTLRDAIKFETSAGSNILTLNTMATGDHYNIIYGNKGGERRWEMQLGTAHAESGTRVGSHFYLTSYDNDGANPQTPFYILRDSGKVGMIYGITGNLTIDGITYTNFVSCIGASPLYLGGNAVHLRPNGYASSANEVQITTAGYVKAEGYVERGGTTGSYGSNIFNFLYVATDDIRCYVDGTLRGFFTPACDYRLKGDVKPIPRCWDAIKTLRPIQYKQIDYGPIKKETGRPEMEGSDKERWGFIAHELQETLLPTAATGQKDGEALQGPNIMAVVAALCSALQEAQLRIEALEAKLA